MSYDPNSSDSMFSRVMGKLDEHDDTLSTILSEVRKTNGRVSALERERDVSKAKTTVIAMVVSAGIGLIGWATNFFLKK